MGGDIVYKRRQLASKTDRPSVNLQSQSTSQIPEPNTSTNTTNESMSPNLFKIDKRVITMGGDIVYKRRRLASRTDKPRVNLQSQSTSQIPEPNTSTKMTLESKVNDQVNIKDSATSENLQKRNEVTSGRPNYASRKRHSSESPDLSICSAAHCDIDLNRTLDRGSDAHNHTRTLNATSWSNDELDCLWVGVRRHGNGNWDAILGDPILRSLAWKTPRDLALRWEEEQLRLLHSRTVSQTPLPRMSLPNPNSGSFMLLRPVEIESALKAPAIANSPLLTARANTEQEESSDADSEKTISDY